MVKTLLLLLNGLVSFWVWLTSECFFVSLASDKLPESIYRVVNVYKLNVGSISLPLYIPRYKDFIDLFFHGHLSEMYMKLQFSFVIPFLIAAVFWYIMYIVIARVSSLRYNRKTTLHGSSRWMTRKEMEKSGLLNKAGVVMGETNDAVFVEERAKKPKRKKGESREDYETRLERWNPQAKEVVLDKPGDLIAHNGNNHTLIVGSTRSGKGVSCIIPTQFNWNESMILLDPKSEGWGITSNFRSRFSYTFKFEPEHPAESIHYNPLLSIRRGRQTIPDIQNLTYILIPLNTNAKDPFWDNEARKLLSAVIGYVIYCEPPERKTFRQVYSIFNASKEEIKASRPLQDGPMSDDMISTADDEDEEDENPDESATKKYLRQYAENALYYIQRMQEMPADLEERFRNRHKQKKEVRLSIEKEASQFLMKDDIDNLARIQKDLTYFAGCEDRQLSSVVSTMMSNLHVIADPNVQEVTDRSDFVMEDFVQGIVDENGKRHPISLYLCVSLASMNRLMPLMKMFYEQSITLLTRELRKTPYRILLVFDEFYQMGKMEVVEKALSLTAGYGVLCAVVIQSYDQLQKLYQSEATFTDNFAYQVILRVNEQKTCEKISSMLGKETKRQKKMSTSGNVYAIAGNSNSFNVEQVGRELMTAEEVRTMPDDDCLIFSSGCHPYKAKKIRYYLDDRFRRLYLDRNGNVLPPPNSPEALEENQPHPEAVDENNRRIGIDDEGWHLLLGFDGIEEQVEISRVESTEDKPEDDFIQDEVEAVDKIEISELNEIDETMDRDELLEFLGLSDYPSESGNLSVTESLEYYDLITKEIEKYEKEEKTTA